MRNFREQPRAPGSGDPINEVSVGDGATRAAEVTRHVGYSLALDPRYADVVIERCQDFTSRANTFSAPWRLNRVENQLRAAKDAIPESQENDVNTIRSFRVPETKKAMANSGIWRDLTEKFGALQDTHGMLGGEWDYTVGSGFGEWNTGKARAESQGFSLRLLQRKAPAASRSRSC